MTRVLLVAATTGYQIRAFGQAAEALGVRLVFASDRCDRLDDPWRDGAIGVRFHDLDGSVAAVRAACEREPPVGVLAVGDRPAVLAAHLAAALSLPGNPPPAAEASRNKLAARQLFAGAGLLTPAFAACSLSQDPSTLPDLGLPVVLKPLALSGSRGVMRADSRAELAAAFARLAALMRARDVQVSRDPTSDQAVLERFIPGREYALEGVLVAGTLQLLALFDKPDPLDGPFFEETIYVQPSRAPSADQRRIVEAVSRAAGALGLVHGAVHAECRVNDEGVYVLEVAPRPIGGLCSRAVRASGAGDTLASLEEVLLRQAIGEDVRAYGPAPTASGVMMIPIPRRGVYRSVAGLDEARRVAGVEDVVITARPDSVIVPLPEGRSYLGFIFAAAPRAEAVEASLRAAHRCLQFTIERELPVVE